MTKRDRISLALILLVAALLRLGQPDITEFFHDEAILSLKAQANTLPLTGIVSSVGIPNPPTSVYVVALPYLFTDNPLWVTLFIAALNVAGVGLLWFIVRRYFNRTTALIAGLSYSVAPWALLYSRKIWAQDYHTPFFLLALLFGLEGFIHGRKWAQAMCLPLLLFALQIHFAAWALLPLYFVLVWMGSDKLSRPALILSLMLSALVLLPYTVGLAQTLQADPDRLNTALNRTEVKDGITLGGDSLRYTAYLATGLGLQTWVAPNQSLLDAVPAPTILWLLIGGVMLVGLVELWRRYRRYALLVTLWALLPTLVFLPTWTKIYPHYFIASIPAYMLLAGLGIEMLTHLSPVNRGGFRLYRTFIQLAFVTLLVLQGMWWWRMLAYVATTEISLGEGTSGFTTPLRYLLPVRDAVREFEDVVVVSDGMWTDFDVEAARWPVMLHNSARCVRTLPGDGIAVFPRGPFAVILAPNAPDNPLDGLYNQTNSAETVSVFPTRSDGYIVNRFNSAPELNVAMTPISSTPFDNGVNMTGYSVSTSRVYLEWSLPGMRDGLNNQYFIHLLDIDNNIVDQRDSSFWPGRHWCEGDRLVTWQTMNTAGAVTLRTGFYALDDAGQTFPVDVLDIAGNPAGNWVDIPLK